MNQLIQMAMGICGGVFLLGAFSLLTRRGKGPGASSTSPHKSPENAAAARRALSAADRKAVFMALQDASLPPEERRHLKGMLGIASAPTHPAAGMPQDAGAAAEPPPGNAGSAARITPDGKNRVMVFSETGEYNIDFKRANLPVGLVVQLEPSMPSRGGHYMVIEKEGRLEAYDPRLEAVVSDQTPQAAYEAVEWYQEVNAVYANKYGLWEKVNTILIALFGFGLIFVAIVALEQLGKR